MRTSRSAVFFGILLTLAVARTGLSHLVRSYDPASVDAKFGPAVLVLLQKDDCIRYDYMFGVLNIAEQRGITVSGAVVDGAGRVAEANESWAAYAPGFRVDPALGSELVRAATRMGFRSTPLVMYVDARGRPLMTVPPSSDAIVHRGALVSLITYAYDDVSSRSR